MILRALSAVFASLPAIVQILQMLDKWLANTPAEKAVKEYKEAIEARQEAAKVKNNAIKEAKQSYTKSLEDYFNKP